MRRNLARRLYNANNALACGRLAEARKVCETILSDHPYCWQARVLIARTAFCRQMASYSVAQLLPVVKQNPRALRALELLALSYKRQGNYAEALLWTRQAASLEPDQPEKIYWHGLACLEAEQFSEAEGCFRKLIPLDPHRADAFNCLGLALQGLGRTGEAVRWFEKAVELDGSSPVFRTHLTEALILANEPRMAMRSAELLIEMRPGEAMGHILLAECLMEESKPDQAENEARRAVELCPDEPLPLANLGSILLSRGKLSEAQSAANLSLEQDPRQGLAYFNLARSGRVSELERPRVEAMLRHAADTTLPTSQRVLLAYALGKAFEDLGEYERSMHHYDEANRLDFEQKFGQAEFDMELNRSAFETVKQRFGPGLFKEPLRITNDAITPIFVCGMMRSGTTLLEQILSAHPEVGGAGEQRFWIQNRSAAFLNDSSEPDLSAVGAMREQYLAILSRIAPGSRFVVDKMPTNYMQLGLIHLAFPTAPIVHIRRHPIDTGLSVYLTHNRVPIPWANSKQHIATNYERYEDLMQHWKRVLPPARIFDVCYEELVSNPKAEIECILAACDLDWSESCLHPELNDRCVITPSAWQVRQPIYQSSVARRRKFEPWLGDLARLCSEPDSR